MSRPRKWQNKPLYSAGMQAAAASGMALSPAPCHLGKAMRDLIMVASYASERAT